MIKLVGQVLLTIRIVVGVAAGFLTSFLLGVPMIEIFLGDCFWEQGCGQYHDLKFIGAVMASGLGGLLAGWGTFSLLKLIGKR